MGESLAWINNDNIPEARIGYDLLNHLHLRSKRRMFSFTHNKRSASDNHSEIPFSPIILGKTKVIT